MQSIIPLEDHLKTKSFEEILKNLGRIKMSERKTIPVWCKKCGANMGQVKVSNRNWNIKWEICEGCESIDSDILRRNTCDNCGHMLHYEHLECPLCGGKEFTQVKQTKMMA